MFPSDDEDGNYNASVQCHWQLKVPFSTDYGILRFDQLNLPSCKSHRLLISEDTLIPERDITKDIVKALGSKKGRRKREIGDDDESFFESKVMHTVEFYREVNSTGKAGIHVVVVTAYCGSHKPNRSIIWKRGSKDVSLSFVSSSYKSQIEVSFMISLTRK